MRRYGTPFADLAKQLAAMRQGGAGAPTQVWIDSLCTYWYESVAEACRVVRKSLPDAAVVLLG
jgi:hypothetical protein